MTRDQQIIRALHKAAVWPDEMAAATWAEMIIRGLPVAEVSLDQQSGATTVQPEDAVDDG